MARAAVRSSVEQIASLSGVAPGTIRRLEKSDNPTAVTTTTLATLQATYESLGVIFEADDGRAAGVRYCDERKT